MRAWRFDVAMGSLMFGGPLVLLPLACWLAWTVATQMPLTEPILKWIVLPIALLMPVLVLVMALLGFGYLQSALRDE